jgi:signal transduction histidine kinase
MIGLLRSALAAPAASAPPRRVWRDWALVIVLSVAIVIEGLLRWSTPAIPTWTVIALLTVPTLLWRRQRPFTMLAIAYVSTELASLVLSRDAQLVSSGFFLVLVYAVFRWGTGAARMGAVALIDISLALSTVGRSDWLVTLIAGAAVMLVTILLGVLLRQRSVSRTRELEAVRARERAGLARDLHDIVAHHVSAITVQAQAGLATAARNPAAAVAALEVIEAEASRTLSEMRAMVRTLRDAETAELQPLPGVAELRSLAGVSGTGVSGTGPSVGVRTDGAVDELPPAIGAALYRIAQESVTNARRHARGATLIDVLLVADDDAVTLTVRDNGDGGTVGSTGFGIPGMTERTALLGGSFSAGPDADGGWVTRATLPRAGWTA